MLLEELLGISNKRLKYIFTGQHLDGDSSSSTESEEENQPIDIISLDDITDSDDEFAFGSKNGVKKSDRKTDLPKKIHKPFKEDTNKHIKIEKGEKSKVNKHAKKRKENSQSDTDKNQLMSVLELLELQARARAIRSQLALVESDKKTDMADLETEVKKEDSDSDAVVIESPKLDEIVISSSDSEGNDTVDKIIQNTQFQNEAEVQDKLDSTLTVSNKPQISSKEPDVNSSVKKSQKVKIIRQKIILDTMLDQPAINTAPDNTSSSDPKDNIVDNLCVSICDKQDTEPKEPAEKEGEVIVQCVCDKTDKSSTPKPLIVEKDNNAMHCISDNEVDEIVINVDEAEVDGMVNS